MCRGVKYKFFAAETRRVLHRVRRVRRGGLQQQPPLRAGEELLRNPHRAQLQGLQGSQRKAEKGRSENTVTQCLASSKQRVTLICA